MKNAKNLDANTKESKVQKAKAVKENSKKETPEKEQKPKGQKVFNFTIPTSWSKELAIFKEVVSEYRGRKVDFKTLFAKAKELRNNPKYDLKPWSELSANTGRNFENRLSRFLGGTIERGFYKQSKQAQYFNIQVWTGQTCSFSTPIDPTVNLSPQVKAEGQSITIPKRKLQRVAEVITKESVNPEFLQRLQNPKTEKKKEETTTEQTPA